MPSFEWDAIQYSSIVKKAKGATLAYLYCEQIILILLNDMTRLFYRHLNLYFQ